MGKGLVISERRIDWVTATARAGSRADALEEYGNTALESDIEDGNKCVGFGFQGYSGFRTQHISVGRRYDSVIVRLGGARASEHSTNVLQRADHCSRLDYCVTVWEPDAETNHADYIWQLGENENESDARLPTLTRTQQRWGGYTTYVGRRASAVMARVYDKHAESRGEYAKGSWRWELELKQHASEQEHIQLIQRPEREVDSPAIVAEQFRRWGVLVPWDSGTSTELWRTPPRHSDLDKTAKRLGIQYTKTAQRYVARYGLRAFLDLFGLNDDDSMKGE